MPMPACLLRGGWAACAEHQPAAQYTGGGASPLPLQRTRALLGSVPTMQGEIETLDKAGIPDESQDLVISNCVVGDAG